MSRILVVRHGETSLNGEPGTSNDKIRGHKNVPLTEKGRQEAKEAGERLVGQNVYDIKSSDLSRAADTGKIIGNIIKVPVDIDKNLRPMNLGNFQGKPAKDAQPQLEKYVRDAPNIHVPGGESFNEFKQRFLTSFQKLIDEVRTHKGDKDTLVVVSHYRNLVCLMAWLADGAKSDLSTNDDVFLKQEDIEPGSIHVLDLSKDKLPKKLKVLK